MEEPWIEKYRPQNFQDIVLSNMNHKLIKEIIQIDQYPNMLFYGPPGTGKTTTILCLIREYQKKHQCKRNYIHLNASHERGVEGIRTHILQFTNNQTFFEKHRKFVLLDEMDSLTKHAQKNLYHVIQQSKKKDITFILICNYLNKVIPCIRNSLFMIHFNKTSLWCDDFIQNCLKKEKVNISKETIEVIKSQYLHDLRSILNALQNNHSYKKMMKPSLFHSILETKPPNKIIDTLLNYYDMYTILTEFFLFVYENYSIDENTIQWMYFTLEQNDPYDFFIEKGLNIIKENLK